MTCPVNSARCGCPDCIATLQHWEAVVEREESDRVPLARGASRPMNWSERQREKERYGGE